MLERDCAVLRQFTGASQLKSYLSVVVQHLFIDFRRQRWGVWRPSTEARRAGSPGIRLDTLINRDQVPLEEAIEQLRANEGVALSAEQLREIADRLPRRPPRRAQGAETAPEPAVPAALAVERLALADVRARRASALRAALRDALSHCADEDAVILRLHFLQGLTIARVAAMLGLAQKPLYRRVERLLRDLKGRLESAGFAANEVAELIGDPAFEQEESEH
jgi:RNA polymerase sigma factor (sigma-70 family)